MFAPISPEAVEQHRRECEARRVLSLPKPERRPWLDSIGKRRGQAAQKYLEDEVIRQHKLNKENA
ncbi:hypothetical protein ACMHYJ_05355 [Castellaniella hirudinis]|uniref:DUF7696 family protein n=1 Tax=Castellaniella hirudinis TaxID=1144617 RepID=UPI0039C11C12